MSYQIDMTPEALAEIKSLPGSIRAQAIQLIDLLAHDPRPSRAKELRGKPGIYRIWLAGRWRIAYEVNDEHQIVTIRRVRSKAQIDYDNLYLYGALRWRPTWPLAAYPAQCDTWVVPQKEWSS